VHHTEACPCKVLRRQVRTLQCCAASLLATVYFPIQRLSMSLTRGAHSFVLNNNSVPIIKHVKEMCDPFIRDYDACVMKNQEDPTVCLDALKRLFLCTEEHGKLPPAGPPRAHATGKATSVKEGSAGANYGYRGGV
jgi:hypothetical protein